jgi:hypothetical protein
MDTGKLLRSLAIALLTIFLILSFDCAYSPPTAGAAGSVYYVSATGNDSNPGTRDRPWASPALSSRRISAGDTLIILGGRYILSRFDDDILSPPSGTSGSPTVIKGEEGNRPVLAGRNNLFSAMFLGNRSYVTVENLEITSDNGAWFRTGIDAGAGPVEHIILRDLYIHHIDEGAVNIGDVNDMQILDSTFTYCGFGAIGGPAGHAGGIRNLVVRNCELSYSGHYYQGGDGSNRPYDRPDGFGIEPSNGPIEIDHTISEHNYGDGLDSKAANTYIHDCIVANNSCDGVKLWGGGSKVENTLIYGTGDGVGGGSPWASIVIDNVDQANAHFEIINVTVHDNPTRRAYPVYSQYEPGQAPIELVIRNSIIANGYGLVFIGDSVHLTADHNIFYRSGVSEQVYANGREYTGAQLNLLGEGNISVDPMFVAPAWGSDGDYHLQAESPGIDAGTSSGAPLLDLDGRSRPQGAAYDIGAYEFGDAIPRYGATYIVAGGFTDPMTPGGTAQFTVNLTNTGSLTWKRRGTSNNPVNLAFHWYNAQGQLVAWDCVRTQLPSDVAPGGSVVLYPQVTTPNVPGRTYILKFDLVHEGVAWFSAQGVPMSANQTANLGTEFGATYQVSNGFPDPMEPGGRNSFTVQLTNKGLMTWRRQGSGSNPVRLAFHWYNASGQLIAWDCVRTELPGDVAPGQTVTVAPVITTPNIDGSVYVLKFDLVKEGVAWFSNRGVAMSAPQTANMGYRYGATYGIAGGFSNPETPGRIVPFTVTLTNTGFLTWKRSGTAPNPVNLAFHWYNTQGQLIAWDCVRTVLPSDAAPGQTVVVTVNITLPNVPRSTYVLRFDLVHEGIIWFSNRSVVMSSPQTANIR